MDCPFCEKSCTCGAGVKEPPGWADVSPLSSGPLHGVVVARVPLARHATWAPSDLTRAVCALGHGPPAVVINVSNSNRWYAPSDFACPVKFIKTPGGGNIPPAKALHAFLKIVRKYRRHGIVVLHCTHGHNRSGFMLVNLLLRSHGYTPEAACAAFAGVRPPGIVRPEYVRALVTDEEDNLLNIGF